MAELRAPKLSPLWIVGSWLVFSVALAGWWVIFAYRFISDMAGGPPSLALDLAGKQRMLVYEGVSLILCLLAGGGALAYYVLREYRRNQQIREFFAAFTHDLKTPIASLRLQAESLGEDLSGSGQATLAKRLLGDTLRLELQLENSLFLANLESLSRLHLEEIRLSKILERISAAWPELKILRERDVILRVDTRAIETIFKNIANNALVHGRAKTLRITVSPLPTGKVVVLVSDDGSGFSGELAAAGELFARSAARGSSGVGLYLVKSLTQKMGGSVKFANNSEGSGFQVGFVFLGRLE